MTPITTPRSIPADIDTGAVILTGEALRRENAKAIADIVAEKGGDFVCATAGHHMEAMLAAYGSGAAHRVERARSAHPQHRHRRRHDQARAWSSAARSIATAAVHIGGRLQVVDADGRIVRLDPAGAHHARRAGFDWSHGDTVTAADLDRVADGMADTLVAALATRPMPPEIARLYLTDADRRFRSD